MLLLKELPNPKSLQKFLAHYPDADIQAMMDFAIMLRAASDISDALDKLLAKHDLLQGRWWVLVLLLREPDLTSSPSALAEKAGVTKGTMTGFIDGLEREGLVKRLMDTVDRRKFLIRLTTAGQQKLDQVMPDYCGKVSSLMSRINAEDRSCMVKSMQTLSSHLTIMK